MSSLFLFGSTFAAVFLGELGDKTQVAAAAGAMSNRNNPHVIFVGTAAALWCTSLLAVAAAWLFGISDAWVNIFQLLGGIVAVCYGAFLLIKKEEDEDEDNISGGSLIAIFFAQFFLVFSQEMGDKTQILTGMMGLQYNETLLPVFLGSGFALTAVAALTVYGVQLIPSSALRYVEIVGAVIMIGFGLLMLWLSPILWA